MRVPDREEIDRAVRTWVLEQEDANSAVTGDAPLAKQRAAEFGHIEKAVAMHMREGRTASLLTTSWLADHLAETHRWKFVEGDGLRGFLEERVARGQRELSVRLRAEFGWEDRPAPTHKIFDPHEFERDRQRPATSRGGPVTINKMFDGYLAESELTAKTIRKWRTALDSLIEHLGHDDAVLVTTEDAIAWKNALLAPAANGERQRGQATVRNGYLGAAKPVFAWGASNKLIEANPFSRVTVRVPRRVRTRAERGYSTSEAKIVLSAASAVDWQSDPAPGLFCRRWLPWLCAYTGARVVEVAQLRREDVAQNEEGIWFITITPSAGSQKGKFARQVALHPHLIEQGFVRAVADRTGPLFFDPKNKKGGSGNSQAAKAGQRVGEWVRDTLGLMDPELQPNHGWRHTFITIARDIGMDEDVRQAIVAHTGKSVHQNYGDVLIRNSYRWLARFPRYQV